MKRLARNLGLAAALVGGVGVVPHLIITYLSDGWSLIATSVWVTICIGTLWTLFDRFVEGK